MPTFVPGWSPHFAARAAARLDASGRFCTVAPMPKTLPPVWSLSKYRINYYMQGDAGSCWLHAAKQLAEVMGNALNYAAFPVCRRLIGYEGKQLEGGGNPSDGGSPTDAIVTMTPAGVGISHEYLAPYTDDARVLGLKPPANVYADAAHSHILAPVKVANLDQAKRLIASGHPVAKGIWWPEGSDGWDSPQAIMRGFSQGEMGHALLLIGFAAAGIIDAEPCIQLDNWHGLLYPPLTPAQAIR